MKAEITLPGRPITKKNHQNALPFKITFAKEGSRTRLHCPRCGTKLKTLFRLNQSKQYQDYETECLWRLKTYYGPKFTSSIRLTCLYWMPDHRGWPDLPGLYQATADILEKAGIIVNDRNVVCMDGSRIVGVDKENPRVEIMVESCKTEFDVEMA